MPFKERPVPGSRFKDFNIMISVILFSLVWIGLFSP